MMMTKCIDNIFVFNEGPMIGKKSGNVGLKPSHSSSCFSSCGKSLFCTSYKIINPFFDGGFFKPPSSTVPTALNP